MKPPPTTLLPASGCLAFLVGGILSAPPQTLPQINIAPGSNQTVTVSWTVPTVNYVLQTATNLTTAAAWQPSPLTIISNDSTLSVSSPLTNAVRFFRLAATTPAVDPYQVLLDTGPNHLWQFDQNGSVLDYVGTVNASVPPGLVTGQPPIAYGIAASSVTTNCIIDFGSSNINNFNYKQSFAYYFILSQSNAPSGTNFQRYALISNLSGSPTNGYEISLTYNSGDQTPEHTLIPTSWAAVSLSFWTGDGDETRWTATGNIPYGQPAHVGVSWNWNTNAGTGQLQVFLNGNFINAAMAAFGTVTTNSTSTNDLLMLNRSGGGAPYDGTIQLVASWPDSVTELQFLKIYLAYALGQTYQPDAFLYSSYKGVDTSNNILRISTGSYVWDTNLSTWSVVGQYFGQDMYVPGAGAYDATNSTKFISYTTPNLAQGSFAYDCVALDGSGISNVWSIERPSRIYNPNTGKWVIWGHQRNWYLGNIANPTNYYAVVGDATNPEGPYTLIASNIMFNTTNNPGDMAALAVGTNGYVFYKDQNDNTWVTQLTSDFHASINDPVPIPVNYSTEALSPFQYGGYTYVMASTQEYYNSILAKSVVYCSASSPMGPYTYQGSALTDDWVGTGFEGQGGTEAFQLQSNTNTWLCALDNWHSGALTNSPVVYYWMQFFGANQNLAPFMIMSPLKEIPFASNLVSTASFPDVTNGLVNRYLFNGSGNDAVDGANCTVIGSPAYASNYTGAARTAVSFNGTDQYMTNGALNIGGAQAYTVSGWYHEISALHANGRSLSDENSIGQGLGIIWDAGTGSTNVWVKNVSGNYVQIPYSALTGGVASNWSMVTVTYDGSSTMSVYVDGFFYGAAVENPGTPSPVWAFGNESRAGTNNLWNGDMSDISFYNRALSVAEVGRLYQHERVSYP